MLTALLFQSFVAARFHPFAVAPLIAVEIVNQRRRFLAPLIEKSERIALQQKRAGVRADLEFVVRAFRHARQEKFPDAAAEQPAHRIDAAIPAIEIADNADALRVRRPDREIDPVDAADRPKLRAEFLVNLQVIALGEEVQIHLAHDRPIGVRIVRESSVTVPADNADAIIQVALPSRQDRLEKTVRDEAASPRHARPPPPDTMRTSLASGRKTRMTRSSPTRCGPRMRNGSGCAPARNIASSSVGRPRISKELMRSVRSKPSGNVRRRTFAIRGARHHPDCRATAVSVFIARAAVTYFSAMDHEVQRRSGRASPHLHARTAGSITWRPPRRCPRARPSMRPASNLMSLMFPGFHGEPLVHVERICRTSTLSRLKSAARADQAGNLQEPRRSLGRAIRPKTTRKKS